MENGLNGSPSPEYLAVKILAASFEFSSLNENLKNLYFQIAIKKIFSEQKMKCVAVVLKSTRTKIVMRIFCLLPILNGLRVIITSNSIHKLKISKKKMPIVFIM